MEKVYALYKGEDILSMGTVDEIAEELNIKKETVLWYRYPSVKKRNNSTKGNKKRFLIELEEDNHEQ